MLAMHPGPSIEHSLLGNITVPVFHDVEAAAQRIKNHINRTPLLRSPMLDEIANARVWLKAENLQVTGSFKARGAFNALLNMSVQQRSRGVIAYSTGNHGQAVAWAARRLDTKATIVMPSDAPRNKILGALRQGAVVRHYDRLHESRETIGMQILADTGGTLIPPGDHPDVLAGQGTVILEALADWQRETSDSLGIFISPCGGGGLAAGSSLVLERLSPATRIFVVEPAGFDDTVRSLSSGRRESNPADSRSICDALQATTPAELPYEINRRLLTGAVAVSDEEVRAAIRFALEQLHVLVEPGGCVALAAVLAGKLDLRGENSMLVLSGGNVDMSMLQGMLG